VNLTIELPLKVKITEREGEVLNLLSKGMNRKEIAKILYVSVQTVRDLIHRLLFKLDAVNSTEAIANAFRMGILE
jgi:DNA-binding NarL/FixJ family response regulator